MNGHHRALIIYTLLCVSISGVARAGEQNARTGKIHIPSGYWSLQLENDFLAGSGDRQYTHGFEVSFVNNTEPPVWMHTLARYLPFFEVGTDNWVMYSLGQAMFTPDDISVPNLTVTDRPYAGWLYAGHAYHSQNRFSADLYHLNMVELVVGLVGPDSGADSVQTYLHKVLPAPDPQGWGHQLRNEAGILLGYVHRWRLFGHGPGPYESEFSPHAALSVGNIYTYAGLGIMYRWGTGLRDDIGPPNIRPGFAGSSYFSRQTQRNWYLFAGAEGRIMYRNIFLDGNSRHDSHRVEKERYVGDVQMGFALHINRMRIAYSHILRSREFTTQSRSMTYGAINLTLYH